MKVKMRGHKLAEAEVAFISLVDRGANRIPFRATKSENTESRNMHINLSKAVKSALAKKQSGEDESAVAVISAYVVQKEDNPHFETIIEALEAAGISTENVEEREDGTVLVKQEGFEDADEDEVLDKAHAVQLGDHVAITVKAFNPYSMKAASYTDVLKSQGFLPSLSVANEALINTIMSTLYAEDATQETVVSKLESALAEFSEYVTGLCRDIPSTAFKAEKAVSEAVEQAVKKAEKKTARKADKGAPPKGKTKGNADADEDADEGKAKKEPAKKDDKLNIRALKSAFSDMLIDALKPVTKAVKDLSKKVDEHGEALDEIKETAEDALELSEKNERKIAGTVIGAEPEDDDDAALEDGEDRSRSRKRDSGELGIIDTAYMPHVRTRKNGYADRLGARERAGR